MSSKKSNKSEICERIIQLFEHYKYVKGINFNTLLTMCDLKPSFFDSVKKHHVPNAESLAKLISVTKASATWVLNLDDKAEMFAYDSVDEVIAVAEDTTKYLHQEGTTMATSERIRLLDLLLTDEKKRLVMEPKK